MSGQPFPCHQRQELIDRVQEHLVRIAELTRASAEALRNGNENLAAELDRQVDIEFGKKERAMRALQQHRKEHGC